MELNEIKKGLYRDKPFAELIHIKKEGILYSAAIASSSTVDGKKVLQIISFLVPLTDIGDAVFLKEMPAQLLIRYIIQEPVY